MEYLLSSSIVYNIRPQLKYVLNSYILYFIVK